MHKRWCTDTNCLMGSFYLGWRWRWWWEMEDEQMGTKCPLHLHDGVRMSWHYQLVLYWPLRFSIHPWGKGGLDEPDPQAAAKTELGAPAVPGTLCGLAHPAPGSQNSHGTQHTQPYCLFPTTCAHVGNMFVYLFCFKSYSGLYINIRQHHCHKTADFFFSSWPGSDRDSCVSIELLPY